MVGLPGSEWLFWSGIAMMVLSAIAAVVCLAVFTLTGRKLKKRLKEEYGLPEEEINGHGDCRDL